MDPRLKLLSYSSLLTLHSCPRKFQLYRMSSIEDETDPDSARNQNVTFAFGHIVGDGVQGILAGKDMDTVIWEQYLGWHADLADEIPRDGKGFYQAMIALQKLDHMRNSGYLSDWEVVIYKGKPAAELSYRITFPDGFTVRGSLDLVLRHKITGEVMVLECKTTKYTNLNPAQYKNSAQGVGYSVVLDVMFPELSSYKVLYLVYKTTAQEYEQLPFIKTYLQKATWIQELLLDIETIKMYDTVGVYPMRGESCYSFFRECEYLNVCQLKTANLTKPCPTDLSVLDTKVYDFELSIEDLIKGQIVKNQIAEAGHDQTENRVENSVELPDNFDPILDQLL